ncbi:MAG: hypothetical protein SPD47_03170 [Oscillospiraceae bacterium]|nr:hypothetical protein [Oscillospiraceae bacterium]
MKRPIKKALGFLTAMAYTTALFCAASMTAAAEDSHGNNQGGTTADDTWNTYTTSKVLDSVNTVAVMGDQFSLYFEAAEYSGDRFIFNPETTITMVTMDGTTTRLRDIDDLDAIYLIASGNVAYPFAQSSTSCTEIHTELTGTNASGNGGVVYNFRDMYTEDTGSDIRSFIRYSKKNGGFGVILPTGKLLEDGKTFDEVIYGGLVTTKIDDTYYYYDLEGKLVEESSSYKGTLEFYDEHTGIKMFHDESEWKYTLYTSHGDVITDAGYYYNEVTSAIGSDGNYYVAVPYDLDWRTDEYYYDYYDADGNTVSADLFMVEEETKPESSDEYREQISVTSDWNKKPDEYGIRQYEVVDTNGRTIFTFYGCSNSNYSIGDDKGSPDTGAPCTYLDGKLFLATTNGLVILDAYTGEVLGKNTDYSYYDFQYMSSVGGHIIMQVGEIVDSGWGEVYQSTGVVLLNTDGTLLSDKYDTMDPTAPYTSHTSFIVSREDPEIHETRYGMISGRGNLVVQLIYSSVYYSDSDISIFTRPNTYQDVYSSPTGKKYASEILMRGSSTESVRYFDNYILLLTTDKYSRGKIGAVVIR